MSCGYPVAFATIYPSTIRMQVHICVHVCMYACMRVCTYTSIRICKHAYMYIDEYIYIHMDTAFYTHIYTYEHACRLKQLYTFIHVYIFTYIRV